MTKTRALPLRMIVGQIGGWTVISSGSTMGTSGLSGHLEIVSLGIRSDGAGLRS